MKSFKNDIVTGVLIALTLAIVSSAVNTVKASVPANLSYSNAGGIYAKNAVAQRKQRTFI